jgi:hypothetical protein
MTASTKERRLGHLEKLAEGLPDQEQAAQNEAETRYLDSLNDPRDRLFIAKGRMECRLHHGWDKLPPEDQDRLARLLAPIDLSGSMLHQLQHPAQLESRIPPGALAPEAAELCLSHIREGKTR